jgi:hypothetical protein
LETEIVKVKFEHEFASPVRYRSGRELSRIRS